jgi:ketosteroid isomerase-like protein
MAKLSEDAVRDIEQIHSNWMKLEVAGDEHGLLTLCADDIQFCPPDAESLHGRNSVSQFVAATTRIHNIEISGRRIRGSSEIAYLTANYKTTFSTAEDPTPRRTAGNHLWILEKRAAGWVVALVSWSVWAPVP